MTDVKDEGKTREELLEEITLLRSRLSSFEDGEAPCVDTTIESNATEKALKAERERLYTILDQFPGFVYLQAPDYSIAFANKRFIEAYGEPGGRPCYEVMWGRKEPCDDCQTFRVFETKMPEVWVSDHASTGRVYQVYDEPFIDTDGSMLVLERSIDITERIRAEEALRESQEQQNALLKAMPDRMFLLDREGKFLHYRTQDEGDLYLPPEVFMNKKMADVMPPEVAERGMRSIGHVLETGEMSISQFDLPIKGEIRSFEKRSVPCGDDKVLEIIRDITERKRAEDETAAKLHYVWSMNEINETLEEGRDIEKMLTTALKKMLSIFDCNRAWLLYPVDLEADSFRVPFQVTTPEYPVDGAIEIPIKGNELLLNLYKELLASREPLTAIFDLSELPEGEIFTKTVKDYEIRSQMVIAFHPKIGEPWMLGLHQCSYAREWTTEEQRLFKDISARITDAVTGALFYKDLKKSEKRLRDAQKIAHIGNWDWDIVKDTLYWSNETYRIFGLRPRDFDATYEAFLSSVHPEDRELVKSSVQEALCKDRQYSIDHRIVLPDATVRSVHGQATVILENGKPVHMIGTVQDITERKRSEEKVNRNYHIQRVISSILQASLKPISLSELLGYSLKAILSIPFISILNKGSIFLVEESGDMLRLEVQHGLPESLKTMCATVPFGRCVCGLAASSRKTVFIDRLGEEHENRYEGIAPHGHYCVPIVSDDRVLGVINSYVPEGHKRTADEEQFLEMAANTLAGIIVRKRGEEEREELHSQLLHSQKMAAIARLTAGIAHDFNNMMTAVNTLSSLGSKKAKGEALLESYFNEINNASKRATALVRQLMLFSKKGPAFSETVDLNGVIEGNLSGIISSLTREGISLTYDLAPELWGIKADTSNIEQIIMNLIINAKDAMPEGGSLTIRTENSNVKNTSCTVCTEPLSGRYVSFEVTDTGVGMESETVQKIFEPFFTTKAPGKGTGLGLSVLYGIVNSLKGCIDVSSAPGEGSAFRVYLPAFDEEKECSVGGPPSLHASEAEPEYGGGELIMFVEDDYLVHKTTGRLLMENGYRVKGAATLADARKLFNEFRGEVGLLLTDVTLPDGDGIELAKELAKVEPGLRVILYSGDADYGARLPSLKELGFEFIEKPFEIPALLKTVKMALA